MNNYIQILLNFLHKYADELFYNKIISNINVNQISIDYLSNNKRGDIASNFFLIINKKIIDKNYDFNSSFKKKISEINFIDTFEISKNGFINFYLNDNFILNSLNEIYENVHKDKIKFVDNKRINIEFVSANPTGPIHIAHLRGAIFGDVLSNLYKKIGYHVIKEYYVNDAGSQIDKLTSSLYKRYLELCNQNIKLSADEYPGTYLIEIAKKIFKKDHKLWLNKKNDEINNYFKKIAIETLLENIKSDLKYLDITFDIFTHESDIVKSNIIEELFDILKHKKLLYEGILPKPKGDDGEWEPRKQLLFKSSDLSDVQDRPFKKSNGEWTYFANDAAYHYDKFKRNFDKLINVWGSDHIGYIPRMASLLNVIQDDINYFEVLTCQIVSLIKDKKKIKMSKRDDNFVTLEELYKKVGKDPIRYYMISTKNETAIDFDLDEVVMKNKDNKVFYCQYAYARLSSVINKAKELNINVEKIDNVNFFNNNISSEELSIIKLLISYPQVLYQSAFYNEPHRIINYLETLCTKFHSIWNKGKDNVSLRFIDNDNTDNTKIKLYWITCLRVVLKDIFSIIGIEPVEKM